MAEVLSQFFPKNSPPYCDISLKFDGNTEILLMEEILHHLGCIRPCRINNLSTGAGFLNHQQYEQQTLEIEDGTIHQF